MSREEEETVYLVTIAVDHQPSFMDNLVRGKEQPGGVIRGGLNHREPINEHFLAIGHSRHQAIDYFRRVTGCTRALSLSPVSRASQVFEILDRLEQGQTRLSISYPDSELERFRVAAEHMR